MNFRKPRPIKELESLPDSAFITQKERSIIEKRPYDDICRERKKTIGPTAYQIGSRYIFKLKDVRQHMKKDSSDYSQNKTSKLKKDLLELDNESLITTTELGVLLDMPRSTIRNRFVYSKKSPLKHQNINNKYYFKMKDVKAYIRNVPVDNLLPLNFAADEKPVKKRPGKKRNEIIQFHIGVNDSLELLEMLEIKVKGILVEINLNQKSLKLKNMQFNIESLNDASHKIINF